MRAGSPLRRALWAGRLHPSPTMAQSGPPRGGVVPAVAGEGAADSVADTPELPPPLQPLAALASARSRSSVEQGRSTAACASRSIWHGHPADVSAFEAPPSGRGCPRLRASRLTVSTPLGPITFALPPRRNPPTSSPRDFSPKHLPTSQGLMPTPERAQPEVWAFKAGACASSLLMTSRASLVVVGITTKHHFLSFRHKNRALKEETMKTRGHHKNTVGSLTSRPAKDPIERQTQQAIP